MKWIKLFEGFDSKDYYHEITSVDFEEKSDEKIRLDKDTLMINALKKLSLEFEIYL